MSYFAFFLLIICGCILGAPIYDEFLRFRIVDCTLDKNNELSKYTLEVTNTNETCIKIYKPSTAGNEVILYMVPETEIQIGTGVQIQVTTSSCSTPLPELYLSLCDDETDYEHTEVTVTYEFNNLNTIDPMNNGGEELTTELMTSTDSMDSED